MPLPALPLSCASYHLSRASHRPLPPKVRFNFWNNRFHFSIDELVMRAATPPPHAVSPQHATSPRTCLVVYPPTVPLPTASSSLVVLRYVLDSLYELCLLYLRLLMCLGAMHVSKEQRRSLFVAQLSGRRREATKTEDLPIEQALVLDDHKELLLLQQLLSSARDKAQSKGSLPKGASMDVEQLWTVMNPDRDGVITYLELEEFLKDLPDSPLKLDEVAKALGIKQDNVGIKQVQLRAKVLIDLPFDEEVGPPIATRLHDLREEAQTHLETNGGDVVQSLIGDKISKGAAAAAAAALAAASEHSAAAAAVEPPEGMPPMVPAHLLSFGVQSLGLLSLVSGSHLEIAANTLVSTRAGSPATIIPRGVLLRAGRWFFEIEILRVSSSGASTFGFVDESFASGIVGDDAAGCSWGVSLKGTRHAGVLKQTKCEPWADGDVIGCLLDIDSAELRFCRNGKFDAGEFTQLSAMGFSPAVTVDCGFLGFVNLGKRPFRHAPPEGVASVQSFIQAERETAFKLRSTRGGSTVGIGQLRATSGGGCARLQGLKIMRPLRNWGWCSSTLSGVLLTSGKHYFELQVGSGFSMWRFGVADALFTGSQHDGKTVGDDKHSWAISGRPFGRSGLLHHGGKQVKWDNAFKNASNNLTIGCAVDVDEGRVHFVYQEEGTEQPVCKVAFEGISFIGGLVPAMGTLHLTGECLLGQSSELLPKLQEGNQLLGYCPVDYIVNRMVGMGGSTPLRPPASQQTEKTSLWVPSSGHDCIIMGPGRELKSNTFLTSLTAPELLVQPEEKKKMRFFYEVRLLELGGVGATESFDPEAKEFEGYGDSDDDDDAAVKMEGGGGATFGWATPRFTGTYYRAQGVGDDRLSWGLAGAEEDVGEESTVLGGDASSDVAGAEDSGKEVTRKVRFKHCALLNNKQVDDWPGKAPNTWCEHWPSLEDPSGATPLLSLPMSACPLLWESKDVVGCGVTVEANGSGVFEFFLNGSPCYRKKVEAPLLLGGVVPAISLHPNMRVRVNLGEEDFCLSRDRATGEEKDKLDKAPPGNYFPVLRARKSVAGGPKAAAKGAGAEPAQGGNTVRLVGLKAKMDTVRKRVVNDPVFWDALCERLDVTAAMVHEHARAPKKPVRTGRSYGAHPLGSLPHGTPPPAWPTIAPPSPTTGGWAPCVGTRLASVASCSSHTATAEPHMLQAASANEANAKEEEVHS